MAELIDKGSLLETVKQEKQTLQGNIYRAAVCMVEDKIKRMPTTTEAEIRAKAISVMGIAMKEVYPTHKANYVEFDVFFRDVMLRVAEQLKECE